MHTQGLGHTLRSLASLLQSHPASKTRPVPPGFIEAFMRRVDATADGMGYSDAVQIAGGACEASRAVRLLGGWDSDIVLIGLSSSVFRFAGLSKLDHEGSPAFHKALLRLLMGCVSIHLSIDST